MPKKGKKQGGKAVAAEADDDFDAMLAALRAADPVTPVASSSSTAAEKSRSNTSVASTADSVTVEAIIAACRQEDTAQLRHWGRCVGVRIKSADPLCECAYIGASLDTLRCLVKDLGADVNQGNHEQGGNTALYVAAQRGHVDVMRCLVKEFGAKVDLGYNEGGTPLQMAAWTGNLDVIRCFVEELGADANEVSKSGGSPLIMAAGEGHLDAVRYFLKFGANVNHSSPRGMTPSIAATMFKHAEVVKWLVKAGAEVDCRTADLSKSAGATAEQTAYLEAKTHCSNVRCGGNGLLKCTVLWGVMPASALEGAQG
jgi:ankyrin repeat protein